MKHFFIIYGALIVAGVAFLLWRKPRRGMLLKLGGRSGWNRLRGQGPSEQRHLNVIFNYNGHSWDAFEVLGLPAGSAQDRVDNAFHEACAKVDLESRPFLEAAYQAIKERKA